MEELREDELKEMGTVRPPRTDNGRKSLLLTRLEGHRQQEVLLVPRSKGHLAGAGAKVGMSGGSWNFSYCQRQAPKWEF